MTKCTDVPASLADKEIVPKCINLQLTVIIHQAICDESLLIDNPQVISYLVGQLIASSLFYICGLISMYQFDCESKKKKNICDSLFHHHKCRKQLLFFFLCFSLLHCPPVYLTFHIFLCSTLFWIYTIACVFRGTVVKLQYKQPWNMKALFVLLYLCDCVEFLTETIRPFGTVRSWSWMGHTLIVLKNMEVKCRKWRFLTKSVTFRITFVYCHVLFMVFCAAL